MKTIKSTAKSLLIKVNREKYPAASNKNAAIRRCTALLLLLLLLRLLIAPQSGVAAVSRSLHLWQSSLIPTLLPFFLLSRLLILLGAAETAGKYFAPLMRPLFDLPGSAAPAVILGFCSGFPTGAATAAQLRRYGLISAEQGARLAAFTNNAGPLYIGSGIAAALLGQPELAPLLLVSHYGSDLLLGILLGLQHRTAARRRAAAAAVTFSDATDDNRSGAQVIRPADSADIRDNAGAERPSLTAVLQEAVSGSIRAILLVGGYMCLFALPADAGAALSGTNPLLRAALSGIWEMTLGMQALSESTLPLALLLPLLSAQLGFGGFSVQLQVLGMLADSDIPTRLYLLCRPLQALLSALITVLLLPLLPTLAASAAATAAGLAVPNVRQLWAGSIAAALQIGLLWATVLLLLRGRRRT